MPAIGPQEAPEAPLRRHGSRGGERMTASATAGKVGQDGIEFFLCSFVEMSGAPKAKLVPACQRDEVAREGAGFAGFAAGDMGQGPHSPDMAAIPDPDSLTVLP